MAALLVTMADLIVTIAMAALVVAMVALLVAMAVLLVALKFPWPCDSCIMSVCSNVAHSRIILATRQLQSYFLQSLRMKL